MARAVDERIFQMFWMFWMERGHDARRTGLFPGDPERLARSTRSPLKCSGRSRLPNGAACEEMVTKSASSCRTGSRVRDVR